MTDDQRPLLRVVHGGDPQPDEMAALVVAVQTRAAAARAVAAAASTPSRWASRQASLRGPLYPGPGAWQASARP